LSFSTPEKKMKVASVAILALLATVPAIAQSTTAPSSPSAAQAAGNMYYSTQPGQMRASKLLGLNIKNANNETIGEINELILDKAGRVAAVVVGVGGFLGIGQREVAIDYSALNVQYDPNAMTDAGATTVTVNANKDSLKSAPAWTWNRDANTGGNMQKSPTPPQQK
jgi:sporulation protein YlmC with PRC-barrel domain